MGLIPDPATSPRLYSCLRWTGLVVGCFAKFVTGSLFVFNAYEGALKATFNYSQTEVELQSSLLNLGLGVGFLPGMFYDKFGPTWTSFAGVIVSVGAYLLLWSTTKAVAFYRTKSWLMGVYFFLCGLGSVFTYMMALNTNVINFHSKHRGKIVGLLNAFLAGSPSIFAVIYYNIFTGPTISDVDSFGNFMFLFAVTFGVADILCMIFLRVYSDSQVETKPLLEDSSGSINSSADIHGDSEIACSTELQPMKLLQLLRNSNFYLFVFMVAFAASVGQVYTNNVTEIATTVLGTSDKNSGLVLIIPIVNGVVSVTIGLFSDRFIHRVPRLLVFIFAGCVFITSQAIVLTLADEYTFLVIGTTLCGIGIGIIWSIGPAIVSEMFYVGNLGRNWGIALLSASIIGFGQQEVFGAIYDSNITNPGGIYCYGMKCIRGGVAMSLSSASMSVIIGVILFIKHRRQIIRKSNTKVKN